MRRALVLLAGCAALTLLLSGCRPSRGSATPTAAPTREVARTLTIAAGEPIDIGVSAALSGDQMLLGQDIADAVGLAVADFGGAIDGHPVRVVRMDDGCADPEMAVQVARELVDRPALAGVIGPMCTTGAQAANSVYEEALTVHIVPSSTRAEISEQGESLFFRTAWRDDVQSQIQVIFARDGIGADSAVVIDDGDPYGRGLADSFAEQFDERGGAVLLRERIERGESDFSSLVRQVVSASPHVVVFEGFNPEGALIVKALREGTFAGAFIGPDGLLSAQDFVSTAGATAEDAILTGGASPDEAFAQRFSDKFGRPPATPFVLQSHDAATALLRAIDSTAAERSDGALTLDREALGTTLHEQEFAGLTGTIAFDDRGDRQGTTASDLGLTIYRVTDGVLRPIE